MLLAILRTMKFYVSPARDGLFMRIEALAILILAMLIASATANDEIERLLTDLSFGDAMSSDESVSVPKRDKPGLQPIATLPIGRKSIEIASPIHNHAAFPISSEHVAAGSAAGSMSQLPQERVSKVVLRDPVTEALPQMKIKFSEAADASPPKVALVQPVETSSAGHRQHGSVRESDGCERVIVCRPLVSPNLPTSTFLEYFRGSPCYSNVWEGYRYSCGSLHEHRHRACGCLKGKHSDCKSCDSHKRH